MYNILGLIFIQRNFHTAFEIVFFLGGMYCRERCSVHHLFSLFHAFFEENLISYTISLEIVLIFQKIEREVCSFTVNSTVGEYVGQSTAGGVGGVTQCTAQECEVWG
jgi:hypothetical protein